MVERFGSRSGRQLVTLYPQLGIRETNTDVQLTSALLFKATEGYCSVSVSLPRSVNPICKLPPRRRQRFVPR